MLVCLGEAMAETALSPSAQSVFDAFPCDLLSKVVLQLPPRDILALAASCSNLLKLAQEKHWDDRVWRQLCEASYGSSTNVACWLQEQGVFPCLFR